MKSGPKLLPSWAINDLSVEGGLKKVENIAHS